MGHLRFASRVLLNYGTDKNCPFCASTKTELMERKRILLHLRICRNCSLMFRWPKETPSFNEKYYQKTYQEIDYTTDLPDAATLKQFIDDNFASSAKNFVNEIAVLKQFLPEGRVLDYGCSWGYGVYQLRQAGFDAFGFEISRSRAEQGRNYLGIEIIDTLKALDNLAPQSVDGVFTSHVLEHIPSLKEVFQFFARILRPGGVLLITVPNGGGKLARELGVRWPMLINEKHPLALDRTFFEKNLSPFGFHVATCSGPYRPVEIREAVSQDRSMAAESEELMVIAHRSVQ